MSFPSDILLVSKARSLPKSGALERYFIWAGSSLTRKYKTRQENTTRDKHSILMGPFINCGSKSLITLTTVLKVIKNFCFVPGGGTKSARLFVANKPFQNVLINLSLIFKYKTRLERPWPNILAYLTSS